MLVTDEKVKEVLAKAKKAKKGDLLVCCNGWEMDSLQEFWMKKFDENNINWHIEEHPFYPVIRFVKN